MPNMAWNLFLFAAGFAAALLLAVAAGFGIVFSGVYDVAATEPHSKLEDWVMHSTMERAVRSRAAAVAAPAGFTDQQILAGAGDFAAMCALCHGAPGQERGEIGKGLNPEPPALSEAAKRWSRAELFWIVKNGVRMTGMPAFGPTHDDAALWNIVGFVERLKSMSPEQYEALLAEAKEQAGGVHSHGAGDQGADHGTDDAHGEEPQHPEEPGHSH